MDPVLIMEIEATLQSLSSSTTSVWAQYEVHVRVVRIMKALSASNNKYEYVVVSDSTGQRIVYNCKEVDLEQNKTYKLKLRASQNTRTMTVTCFVIESKLLHTQQKLEGEIDFTKKVSNMVQDLELTLDQISVIEDELESSLVSERPYQDYRSGTLLLKLKDERDRKYFYRVWKQDQEVDRQKLHPNVSVRFKDVTVSKKEDSDSVSLSKNKFTKVLIEDYLV